MAAFKITKTHAIITFSIPVNLNSDEYTLTLDGTTKFETKNWKPIASSTQFSTIWMLEDSFALNNNSNENFQLEFSQASGTVCRLAVTKIEDCLFGIKVPKFGYEFGAAIVAELQEQLNSCQQLLEYEPDSKCKWN